MQHERRRPDVAVNRRTVGKVIAASVAAVWLGLYAAAAAAAPGPQAGEVLVMSGQCIVESEGQRNPLKPGDAVHVGDTVDVPQGAKLKLRMKDGSVVSAASGSRLTIDAYEAGGAGRDAKLSLAAGLLRAVVAPLAQPSRFEVQTATGVAAVRSTDWFIEATPGATQVGVLRGAVNLSSAATGRSVTIPARWGARVEAGKNPVPSRVWAQSEFDAVIARTDVE
jgi:hypothetical protein